MWTSTWSDTQSANVLHPWHPFACIQGGHVLLPGTVRLQRDVVVGEVVLGMLKANKEIVGSDEKPRCEFPFFENITNKKALKYTTSESLRNPLSTQPNPFWKKKGVEHRCSPWPGRVCRWRTSSRWPTSKSPPQPTDRTEGTDWTEKKRRDIHSPTFSFLWKVLQTLT